MIFGKDRAGFFVITIERQRKWARAADVFFDHTRFRGGVDIQGLRPLTAHAADDPLRIWFHSGIPADRRAVSIRRQSEPFWKR
jgi:hypothetical protein